MQTSKEFMRGWLVGIFDGEGCMFFRGQERCVNHKKLHSTYHISMSNTDVHIINKCVEYLAYFNINCIVNSRKKMSKPNWKQVHNVIIYKGQDIIKFYKEIGFIHPLKAQKLSDAVNWINRPKTKYDIKEIQRLYWKENLSYQDIAKKMNIHRSQIQTLFNRWNIPRRDRLSALKNHYL